MKEIEYIENAINVNWQSIMFAKQQLIEFMKEQFLCDGDIYISDDIFSNILCTGSEKYTDYDEMLKLFDDYKNHVAQRKILLDLHVLLRKYEK